MPQVPPRSTTELRRSGLLLLGVQDDLRQDRGASAQGTDPSWRTVAGIPLMAITFSDFSKGLVLIAGPCVIESEEHVQLMARAIRSSIPTSTPYVFKASFDKA